MMYTETFLKNAAENNAKIGDWKGSRVYACSKNDIDEAMRNVVYILYDDNNLMYYDGYIYGTVDKYGNVEEFSPRKYKKATPKKEAKEVKEESAPTCGNEEPVIGDVALGLEVDKVLDNVRTMTVDDLLQGFNYGLD